MPRSSFIPHSTFPFRPSSLPHSSLSSFRTQAKSVCDALFAKFLSNDSQVQVCISESFMEKTLRYTYNPTQSNPILTQPNPTQPYPILTLSLPLPILTKVTTLTRTSPPPHDFYMLKLLFCLLLPYRTMPYHPVS